MFHSEPSSAVYFHTSDVAINEALGRIQAVALNVVRWSRVRYILDLVRRMTKREYTESRFAVFVCYQHFRGKLERLAESNATS